MNRDPGRDFQVVGLAADGVDGARQGPLRQAIRRCPGDMIAQVQPQSQGGEKIPFHTSPHINAQQIAGPQHCPDLAGNPWVKASVLAWLFGPRRSYSSPPVR